MQKRTEDKKSRCIWEEDGIKSWCAGELGAEGFLDCGKEEGGVMEVEEFCVNEGVSQSVIEWRRSGVPVLPYFARSNAEKNIKYHSTFFF